MTGKKRGRPSKYNYKLASEICHLMAQGRTLRSICKEPGMPDETTVRAWALDNVNGFSPLYARARELQVEAMAEDLLEIAHAGGDVAFAKLQIDTRKWVMSKTAPKKYGDKIAIGGDKSMDPIKHMRIPIDSLTDEQLEALEPVISALASSGPSAEGNPDGTGEEEPPRSGGRATR